MELRFSDTRRFGRLWLLRKDETDIYQVYGHEGEPCPICGTTLRRRVLGGQSSISSANYQKQAIKKDICFNSNSRNCAIVPALIR